METVEEARAGWVKVESSRSIGKEQRLGRGGTEREPDALEMCITHVRRRQGKGQS